MFKSEKGDTNTTRNKLRAKGMKQLYHLWCYPESVDKIRLYAIECNHSDEEKRGKQL